MKNTIKQLPEHISAVRKNRKFLHMQSNDAAGASGQLFRQEVTADHVGLSCAVFDINDFTYDHEKSTLTLNAVISFPEKCKCITLQADLLDEETEQVVTPLEEKTVENSAELNYVFKELPIKTNSKLDKAEVILYADWIDSGNAEDQAAVLEDESGTDIRYEHTYPQKETDGYKTFGNTASDIAMELAEKYKETEGREESENIVIAMFRKPDDTKDLDYLCLFDKIGKYPPVSVPAKGTLFTQTENTEFVCDTHHPVSAICTITPSGSTGAVVAAVGISDGNQYLTNDSNISIDAHSDYIQYEMTKSWNIPFEESGNWDLHDFSYELSINCTLLIGERETNRTYFISSTKAEGKSCLTKIPNITMKWGCLAEGTQIIMDDGTQKAVEDICVHDRVKTGSNSAEVINMWRGTQDDCIRITADNGRELIMTEGHPILTECGWKRAGTLTIQDVLKTESGSAEICGISRVPEEIRVVNPETGGKPVYANGFIVGDFNIQNSLEGKEQQCQAQ